MQHGLSHFSAYQVVCIFLHKICMGLLWSFFLDLIGPWNCFDNDFGGREFSRNSHSGTFSQIYPRIGDIVVTVKETGRCFRVKIVSVPFGSGIGVDRVRVFLLIFLIWFPCSNEFTSLTPTTKSNILQLFKLYYLTYYTLNGLENTCTALSRVHVTYEPSIHDSIHDWADTTTNWVRMLVKLWEIYACKGIRTTIFPYWGKMTVFLTFPLMFSFCKPKPKQVRLPFSGKFLSNLPNH